jgi:hypothetical protein
MPCLTIEQGGQAEALDESLDLAGRKRFLFQIDHVDLHAALFEEALGGAGRLRILQAENLDAHHTFDRSVLSHVAAEDDARAVHQDRALDEVRVLRHQLQGFGSRGRREFHIAFAVELISGIQELAVVTVSNQVVERLDRKALVEIDFLKLDAFFAK